MTTTRLANRVPALLLSSPLHRLMGRDRILLQWTGRRSGRRYATPVDVLRTGSALLATTDSGWWHNFEQSTAVTLWLDGRNRSGTAVADRDQTALRDTLTQLVATKRLYARAAGIPTERPRVPKPGAIAEAAESRVLVRITVEEVTR